MASSDPTFRPASPGAVHLAGPRYVAEPVTAYAIRDNLTHQLVTIRGDLVAHLTPEAAEAGADRWNRMNGGIKILRDVTPE